MNVRSASDRNTESYGNWQGTVANDYNDKRDAMLVQVRKISVHVVGDIESMRCTSMCRREYHR